MPRTRILTLWRYVRPILAPVILCALVVLVLREPITSWLSGEERYDQEALREWLREARVTQTLPELLADYVAQVEQFNSARNQDKDPPPDMRQRESRLETKREEIFEQLQALGNPPTKIYRGQLPLFPVIYRLSIHFDKSLDVPPIFWDSGLPRQKSQYRSLDDALLRDRAWVNVAYHLHAYNQRQVNERQETTRRLWLSGLGLFFAVVAFVWIYVAQRRERDRQRQRNLAEQQMNAAERLRLQEELRRQEAERRHQVAEHQNLELKSQLFANIGIMAGSYAHNIKNLLVRPNDLLRRCLEENSVTGAQATLLNEVRQTLGTVTERLQQILQTVRRDPSRSESVRIDLNALVAAMHRTWTDLAREKWKLNLDLDLGLSTSPELDLNSSMSSPLPALTSSLLPPEGERGRGEGVLPLWIEGDLSHLQQALENLLFNARDATFEMRNHLRDQARQKPLAGLGADDMPADPERRHALIAAAAWKGHVVLRTRCHGDRAILEVQDNGIGMTEEVRRRCTETHFSTKRDNALFAGLSAGMGLGLSFVTVILEHHHAELEIESEPLKGTTFRVSFSLLPELGAALRSKDGSATPE